MMRTREELQEEYGFFNNLGRERTQVPFSVLSTSCLYENKNKNHVEKAVYEINFSLPPFVNESSSERTKIVEKEKQYPNSVVSDKLLFHPREGDTVMFHIPNQDERVNEVLSSRQVIGKNETDYSPQPFLAGEPGQSNVYIPEKYQSAFDLLRTTVRLEPLTPSFIEYILEKAKESDSKLRIIEVISSGGIRKIQHYYSIRDFLSLFPDVKISVQDIVDYQRRLGRRTYDIGHIDWEQKTLSITVALNAHHPQNPLDASQSKVRYGATSSALMKLNPGDTLYGHIKRYVYALPERFVDSGEQKPIILIAPGSAFGSTRQFLQERIAIKQKGVSVGKVMLITGSQYYPANVLYEDDIHNAQKAGILESAHFAASRGIGKDSGSIFKVYTNCYVSDIVWRNQDYVWSVLQQGGAILINGPRKIAEGVKDILICIVQQKGRLSKKESENYLDSLRENFQLMEVTSNPV